MNNLNTKKIDSNYGSKIILAGDFSSIDALEIKATLIAFAKENGNLIIDMGQVNKTDLTAFNIIVQMHLAKAKNFGELIILNPERGFELTAHQTKMADLLNIKQQTATTQLAA